ncbi:MAG TPA: CPBP family glutamic-type intramembrane protease [Thermoanaerobaculia bacterium]|nr:CPBP family glutamic-type intramembrane protease [Thermoanaerobaculia bacterium]
MSRPAATDAFAPEPRPLAVLGGVALWLGVTVVVSALAAPPLFHAIQSVAPGSFPFERVFRRVAMLVALVHLIVWLRRAGVRSWAAAGFTSEGWRRGRVALVAGIGLASAAAMMIVDVLAGARLPELGLSAAGAAKAILGATLIGLVEEGAVRGALVFPFGRIAGAWRVAVVTLLCAVYSTGHFARTRGGFEVVDWTSGFELWQRTLDSALASPEPWIGLFALGLLFDTLARRQGHVWGAVALHAGAVAGIQLGSDLTANVPGHPSLFFTNGLHPSWLLAAILGVATIAVAFAGRARSDPERV